VTTPERKPWAPQSRYTVSQAVGECQWEIALNMGTVALMAVLLGIGGAPWIVTLVIVILFGPVATTAAILGRVYRRRRGLW
jgi:hypothetical protein